MRKFRSKSEGRDGRSPSAPKANMRSVFLLLAIAVLALIVRVAFAFDTAVSDGFAFSGSSASYHHRVITTLLETGVLITSDGSMNYPFGSINPNPPGFDLVAAAVAFVGTSLGMLAPKAAYIALLSSSPVLGTLSAIVAYFLGKEVFGKKSAGLLAALFVALCPIVITQTVLSNATEIPFVLFLSLIMAVFAFRAVSNIPQETDSMGLLAVARSNRAMLFNSLMAGLAFLCIMLSWGAYRPLLVVMVAVMAVTVLSDRFTGRDPRASAIAFILMIALPSLLSIPVHMQVGLWEPVMFGNTAFALICVGLCFGFAMARKLPWTLTVPVFTIITAGIFVYLGMFAEGMLSTIAHGGSVAPHLGVDGRRIPLSMLSVMFGWATLWFGWVLVGMRIFNLPANKDSRPYMFLISWMVAIMAMGWESDALAALAAPAYALGFAGVMIWLFRAAGLSEYYQGLKGVDAKTALRRLVKPIPFFTVLGVALLVVAPNAMYAIDSGISHNDKADYNDRTGINRDLFGSIGYYIEGADAKERSDFFDSLSGMTKTGALVTGQSNVIDASGGGFQSVSDAQGNGMVAASHILLSNGANGEAIAAMMYRIISSKGGIAGFEAELKDNGLSNAAYNELVAMEKDVGKYRAAILSNPDVYGKLRADIDNESVRYVFFKKTLVAECNAFQIAEMYDAVCDGAGSKITYLAVSGDMLPLSMQSQVISNMYVAGYGIDSSATSEFINVSKYGQQNYFSGVKDVFADTVLWRAAIGLNPSGDKTAQSLVNSVGNGSATPAPGSGISCFKVVKWHVKYNPLEDAKYDSEGWVVLPANQAIAKYEAEGGTIGYISSLPVILEYVSPAGSSAGTVTFEGGAVAGIEVSTVDIDSRAMTTAFTDADGKYTLPVIGGEYGLRFRAGTVDGKGITLATLGMAPTVDYAMAPTSFNGTLSPVDGVEAVKFVGKASGGKYEANIVGDKVEVASLIPDVYAVSLMRGLAEIKALDVTIYPGANTGYEIKAGKEITVTLRDAYGGKPSVDIEVRVKAISDTGFEQIFTIPEADGGEGKTTVPNVKSESGLELRYAVDVTTVGYLGHGEFDTGSSNVSVTYYGTSKSLALDGAAVNMLYDGYGYRIVEGTIGFPDTPLGTGHQTVYSIKEDNQVSMTVNDAAQSFSKAYKVHGKLMDGETVIKKGTVGFINAAGAAVYVSAFDEGYEVYLPAGNYDVYSFSSDKKKVHYGDVEVVDKDVEKDLTMESGREVYGYVSAMGKNLRYVAVTITSADVTGFPSEFILPTDSNGRYSLVLPMGKGAKAEVDPGTDFTGTTFREIDGTKTSFTSISLGKKVNVTNNTGYTIKLGGVEILEGASADVTFTSTTLKDDAITSGSDDRKVKWSDLAVLNPEIDPATFVFGPGSVTVLHAYAVDGAGNVSFKIKPTAGGSHEVSDNKVFLEHGEEFTITVTGADGKMEIVRKTLTATLTETLDLKDPLTVKTFVGTVPKGSPGTLEESKVYVVYDGIEIEFTKGDGNVYSATMPYVASVEVKAEFKYKFAADGLTRDYESSATAILPADAKDATVNISLEYSAEAPIDTEGEKIMATATVSVHDITEIRESMVEFKVDVNTTEASLRTLTLSGINWKSIRFYSDPAFTNEIASISSDVNAAAFYVRGVYDGTEYAANDLKVALEDLGGKEVAKASLVDSGVWSKTVAVVGSSAVGIDAGVANEFEYAHAVKLVNGDNYSKTFNIKANYDPAPGWLVRLVTDDGKVMSSVDAAGKDVIVPGNSTMVVYVKFTSALGDKSTAPAVLFEVTCPGGEPISAHGDDFSIEGGTAKFKSTPTELDLGITDGSASGRGVFNADGKVSNTVWVFVALIVLMLILTVWMGMRRGVFTRRK